MIKIKEEKSIVIVNDYNKKAYEKDVITHLVGSFDKSDKITRTIRLYENYIYDETEKRLTYKHLSSAIFYKTVDGYKFITNVNSTDQIEIYSNPYDYNKDSLIIINLANNNKYYIRYYNFTNQTLNSFFTKEKKLEKKLTKVKKKNKH